MFRVGITGGIGSGKSVVAKLFTLIGIPIFDADKAAKWLMNNDENVKQKLTKAFGSQVFKDNILDRKYLAEIVFKQPEQLQILNSIVHPAVKEYGITWAREQTSPYTIKEAAILFESNSHTEMDLVIGVSAPYEQRLQQAMQRDGVDAKTIRLRMDQQMEESEKMKLCDYIIINDGKHALIEQVVQLHKTILTKINKN